MALNARNRRFTIYDMMEAKGIFAANPANADAGVDEMTGEPIYKGPVRYPLMMYHPEGLERIIVDAQPLTDTAGNAVLDRNGDPIMRGEQREIVWQLVHSLKEERALRKEGWHDHPADAIAASGKEAPSKGTQQVLDAKDREIERLQAQLAELSAKSGDVAEAAVE